eukprot:CAMPEP_0198211742 /NCGR_PEP_ID=MMETSP1445-20131203/25315_1 /TAXON_ID=36898 /ORGANISM="Pyramimonas sp., Strain CCMP2087" /LENGTH=330 /DNA_ID=CAMNT_0043886069 /DNA_START=281 /DNA_END=1273 /DNA_ORIENTATION=+
MTDIQTKIHTQRQKGKSFGFRRVGGCVDVPVSGIGEPVYQYKTPPLPGPGAYEHLPKNDRLAPRLSVGVPSFFHRSSTLDDPINFSGGCTQNILLTSPKSPLSPMKFRTLSKLDPMGQTNPLSPTSPLSPNALFTPNTARSITSNGEGSLSPFLLGANTQHNSLHFCPGAHVTAGTGSTFGNRTRHSCFTRGTSGLARDTTLHPVFGGRSTLDRHLDDHTLGPGQYGEVCDMNQSLFGPAAAPVSTKTGAGVIGGCTNTAESKTTRKFLPPSKNFSPERRSGARRPDNLPIVPPPGAYDPSGPNIYHDRLNVTCDARSVSFNPKSLLSCF